MVYFCCGVRSLQAYEMTSPGRSGAYVFPYEAYEKTSKPALLFSNSNSIFRYAPFKNR
jgi:hypothetical protein